jgi:chemotaxis signal transduction protein
MTAPDTVAERLAALRTEFDGSFGRPVRPPDAEHAELLTLRAGSRRYALRLAQTSGLHPDRPVTPLPGPLPALLGLAGFGGTIVPVYDLAALLGHPGSERPRWLVLAAGAPPLALAFTDLDGHVRVPAAAIVIDGHAGADGVRGMVTLPGGPRPLVDVPGTRAVVRRLTGHTAPGSAVGPPGTG